MKISTLARGAALAIALGFAALVATNYLAIQELKVRGPVYERIVLGKDLVADILPPPLYTVEAYLEATKLVREPQSLEARRARLVQLHKEYDERAQFWAGQTFDPIVKDLLLKQAHEPARRFWNSIEKDLLPAIAKKDAAAAERIYASVGEAYVAHREKIEEAVKEANRMTADIETASRTSESRWTWITWGMSLVILLLVGCSAVGLLLMLLWPLDRLRTAMLDLASGKRDILIEGLARRDEIGAMAQSVDLFRLAAIEQQRLEAAQTEIRAKEQLRQHQLETQVKTLQKEVSSVIEGIGEQIKIMRESAKTLSAVAATTTTEAEAAAHASNGAADNAQAVAAATEELGASIREIATQAHRTSDIVTQTTEAARKTNGDVAGLAEAAEKIGSIVEIIRNVAEQTNLLALNATIEAARAGEAGRGFAVVATEVKSLAAQTAKATGEISSQIENVQGCASTAVDAIRAISNRIDEINGLTGGIAAAVEEQEAATREIAQNVTTAADRSRAAASSATGVLGAADQARTGSATMSSNTDKLTDVAEKIATAFDRFVKAISEDIQERRRANRHPIDWETTVVSGTGETQTRAQDISRAGIRLDAMPGLSAGAKVKIDFGCGPTTATVIWKSDYATGLAFETQFAALPVRPADDRSERRLAA
jgi:methyl-accepting chemotaxis protein